MSHSASKATGLIPPPGYTALEPLEVRRHAGLGLLTRGYGWTAALPAVPLGAVEMARAALDYPLAFVRDARSEEYVPVALLGLDGRNQFIDAQGRWRTGTYVPAYVRRYPFCLADLPERAGRRQGGVICVEAGALGRSAQPLFDSQGRPTAAFSPIRGLIEAMESARLVTRRFTKRLEALGLLAGFDAVAQPTGGAARVLKGLYRIDEPKLAGLPAKQLRTLIEKGEWRAIYAHLLSLENFGRLLDGAQSVQ